MTPSACSSLTPELVSQRDHLLSILRDLGSVAVAFSGGIDSTVVAQAAFLALGERAVAVTADSPSVPRAEIDEARRLAQQIGIRHEVVCHRRVRRSRLRPQRRHPLLLLQERAVSAHRNACCRNWACTSFAAGPTSTTRAIIVPA